MSVDGAPRTAVETDDAAAGRPHEDAPISMEGVRRRRKPDVPLLPTWREALGPSGIMLAVALTALFIWLYQNQCYRLYRMWQNPDWSHGFLVPLFCLYMVHARKEQLLSGAHSGSLWGLALIVSGVAAYAYFVVARIGYPQDLSMLVVISGLVLLLRGWRTLKITLFPIGFFLLAIPPPDYVYKSFTQPLQQGAAKISTIVMNLFPGAEVEQAGINIAYYLSGGRHGTFTVAGACSGMRSLMAFVALGLFMAYFAPRPLWQRVTMALCVVPVALFCNVVRVIITGSFQMYGHGNLATGTPHMVLGLLMFGLGFAIYGAILWALDHLFVEADEGDGKPPLHGAQPPSAVTGR